MISFAQFYFFIGIMHAIGIALDYWSKKANVPQIILGFVLGFIFWPILLAASYVSIIGRRKTFEFTNKL